MRASQSDRRKWLAIVLAGALDEELMTPEDVLAELTPDVLADHLPPQMVTKILAESLGEGSMTAAVILRAVGPTVLTRHVPAKLVWSTMAAAAERANIVGQESN